jgi:DNA-binding CsgD family transcriptional regulator
MHELELSDVEQIVHLVAQAGDPTVELTLPQRKRLLLEGVAALIDAEVWIWSTSVPNPNVLGDVMTTCLIDGGWRDAQEQTLVYEALTDRTFADKYAARVVELMKQGNYLSLMRDEIIPPEHRDEVVKLWHRTGLDHSIFAFYPLDPEQFSGIGFHRRIGSPAYTERDRSIVHVVFRQVGWLHKHGVNDAAKHKVVQLTPRERQVLMLLLGGDSKKLIARKLGISEHTVGDHMKRLHKHFAVNSRAELQGFFLVGTPGSSPGNRLA